MTVSIAHTLPAPVLAIDGPGGAGKGTISRLAAAELGWHYLDSGALYRLTALAASNAGIDLHDEERVARLASTLDIRFGTGTDERVWLAADDVSALIRDEQAGTAASVVAALPAVRQALLHRQQAFRQLPGLVADGRDMGTVVFPDATLKVFLTASSKERAERRYKQLIAKGIDVNIGDLLADIKARDERDSSRSVAPLRPADDAVILDTSGVSIQQVLDKVLKLIAD
jgi:CMP/dCMP kinase